MKPLTPLLFLLLLLPPLSGCPETVPDVECAFQLPGPGTDRVSSREGFNLVVQVSGAFSAEELAAVHFVSDVEATGSDYEDGVLLEAAITIDDAGCANGCQAGGRLETAITPGAHRITAMVLTPRGTAACEAEIELSANSPPSIQSALVAPVDPRTGDDISFTVEALDAEGDTVDLSNTWTGPAEQKLNGPILTPIQTTAGEVWSLSITPRDEFDSGDPFTVEVTIDNTPPAAPTVVLTPSPPRVNSSIHCNITNLDDLDPDGDELTVTWAWERDATDAGVTEAVVPAAETGSGETWACLATVSDASATSDATRAEGTVVATLTVPATLDSSTLPSIAGDRVNQLAGDAGGIGAPGDVDGDGLADFVITANDGVCFECSANAHAYLFLGSAEALPGDISGHDVDFQAPEEFRLGAPGPIGDINGDGLDELVIPFKHTAFPLSGGRNGVYIVFGRTGGWLDEAPSGDAVVQLEDLLESETSPTIKVVGNNREIGQAPCSVGDLDGDGLDELALSAPEANEERGVLYIAYGHLGPWFGGTDPHEGQGPTDLVTVQPGFQVEGGTTGGLLGHACAGPLDLDGDGLRDLVIGAPGGGVHGNGRVVVFLGNADRDSGSKGSSTADVLIDGEEGGGGQFGSALAALGDHDGDGRDDFAVFEPAPVGADDEGLTTYGGTVWIASGGAATFTQDLPNAIVTTDLPYHIEGGGNLGFCGHPAGVDLDGDGLGDLVCGDVRAEASEDLEIDPAVRIFLGSTAEIPASRTYETPDLLLTHANLEDVFGVSIVPLRDRNGDGYGEILVGAPGVDGTPLIDSGEVYLVDLAE